MSYQVLVDFMLDYGRSIHTIKPALVTKVDLQKNTLDAKILTATKFKDGSVADFVDVADVPFFILSANKGNARITFPVSAGDLVIIVYSDRDISDLLTSKGTRKVEPFELRTHSDPILAFPCFFTAPNAKPVDPTSIVIENGVTSVKILPTGQVEINAPTTLVVNSPATVFTGTIATAGIIPLPGAASTPMSGDFQIQGNIDQTGNLTVNGVDYSIHRHAPSSVPPTNP